MRDEHDRGVERDQVLLEPLERRDVEMVGRLVEQQQVGVAGERPGERGAGQLAAGERGPASGRGRRRRGTRARAALPARDRASGSRRRAPGVPAPPRSGRASTRRGRRRAIACSRRPDPPRSRPAPCAPERTYSRSEDAAFAWRALVVQRDLDALREHQLPASIDASPESIRSSVVLPAPLRPDRVIRSRRSSLNEIPRSSGSPRCPCRGRMRSRRPCGVDGRTAARLQSELMRHSARTSPRPAELAALTPPAGLSAPRPPSCSPSKRRPQKTRGGINPVPFRPMRRTRIITALLVFV